MCSTSVVTIQASVNKMYKLACAPIEDSDQHANPGSLIRIFGVRSVGNQGPNVSSADQNLHECRLV